MGTVSAAPGPSPRTLQGPGPCLCHQPGKHPGLLPPNHIHNLFGATKARIGAWSHPPRVWACRDGDAVLQSPSCRAACSAGFVPGVLPVPAHLASIPNSLPGTAAASLREVGAAGNPSRFPCTPIPPCPTPAMGLLRIARQICPILGLILSPTGLRSRGGVGADPGGSGDVGRVRLGSAALRAHGAGPQPLHHRAERLQGRRLPLLCQLGGSPAVGHPGGASFLRGNGAKARIWGPVSVAPLFFSSS